MPKKNAHITITDQFCGAGGSSQGARKVALRQGGIEIKLALNHWKLAIETHNTNFPDTIHDCTDISAADPRRYPSTDILITSPECTNHSPAGGKKKEKKQMDLFAQGKLDPAAERSRATMWDVPRFAEYHQYNLIIVENVVEARKWIMFDAWLMAMHSLGYKHECVYRNSMHHHPTPQSRDRMYIVFWKKGNKAPNLEYNPLARCGKCEKDTHSVQTWKNPRKRSGKFRKQYVYCCPICTSEVEPYYYAAFNCIDWTDIGQRIGDRPEPLSPNTINRIEYGKAKYGKYPLVVRNYSPGYSKPASMELGAITCQDHHSLFSPFIIKLEHGGKVKSAGDALLTQTSRQSDMVISAYVKGIEDALPTQTTCQGMGFAMPLLTEMYGTGKARPITAETGTITAGGVKHGLVTSESWNSFIASYYGGSKCTKHITEETGTFSTRDRMGLFNYREPAIEDCYYRMLKAKEVKLGMAFEKDYIILGNGRDQVKQCGNAVTPPVMEWLVERCIDSLK